MHHIKPLIRTCCIFLSNQIRSIDRHYRNAALICFQRFIRSCQTIYRKIRSGQKFISPLDTLWNSGCGGENFCSQALPLLQNTLYLLRQYCPQARRSIETKRHMCWYPIFRPLVWVYEEIGSWPFHLHFYFETNILKMLQTCENL